MKCVAYLRVSTDAQSRSGLGLEAQEAAIRTAAARLNLPCDTWCRDLGVSGTVALDKRPGLLDALQALRKGDVLLVAKRDRIARDPLIALLVEKAVTERKARIVSAAGEGSDDDDTSRLLRAILDAVAQFERAMTAARTRASLKAKLARGERAGRIRFGYQLDPNGPRHRESKRLQGVIPHPEETAALQALRAHRVAGASLAMTAATLNLQGYRTRAGSPWRPQYVASLERRHASL